MSASPPASIRGEAAPANKGTAYHDAFGGSDLSELSEEEAPRVRKILPFPPRAAVVPAARADVDEDTDRDDDDQDDHRNADEDRDEDDVYVPGTAAGAAKIPKFKKQRRPKADEDVDRDEVEGEEERNQTRKKKKRNHRRERREEDEVVEETAEPVYDEKTQRRLALEHRIDNIGKKTKIQRRKRKGDDDVDIVDSYHDDICVRLRERMIIASEKDKQSNIAKMPATVKLVMLDEVMSVLRNTTLWQSIVDNGVLDAVRAWLEPVYPTGALPAVGIQRAIFEVLPKMDLDTQTLKECRLGPIILFYTKTRRVTPVISRQADALVQAWSRPIIKRPANFRSRHVDTLSEAIEHSQTQVASQGVGGDEMIDEYQTVQKSRPKRFDVIKALKENQGRKGARLFVNKDVQYTVAPQARTNHHPEDIQHVSRIQTDNKKFNKFVRQMKGGKGGR